jgi:CheY-like chemotaxis protein
VLICDDDALLRQVVRSVVESAGHEVIAETDNAVGAIDLLHRFSPDVIVLDLALASGLGDSVIAEAKAARAACRVIVFSAYATEPDALLKAGAAVVIEKPRFDDLEATLRAWGDLTPGERRQHRPDREAGAPIVRSPSGLEEGRDFYTALAASKREDALLMFRLEDFDSITRISGEVIGMDWILLLARVVRAAIRENDRLACLDGRRVHALLLGGSGVGREAVLRRVDEGWKAERGHGGPTCIATHAVQDGQTPADVLLRRAGGD